VDPARPTPRPRRPRLGLPIGVLIGGSGLALVLLLALPVALPAGAPGEATALRALLSGLPVPPGWELLEISSPEPAESRSNEALEVFLHFPRPERVRPETLEVRLNGADVTPAFATASNGAYGDVLLLVDGENLLEVSIFGRAWWSGDRLVEQTVHRRFRVRRPIDRNWG